MAYCMLVLALIIPLLGIFYYYLDRKNNYWTSRGVAGPKPWPIVGNFLDFQRKGQVFVEKDYVAKYGKVYGIYSFVDPVLTIADAELIKQVLIKDFHVFVNRDKNPIEHEIWSNHLFASEDEQWKRIRAITSPSFTTGKLRGMHALMNKCIDKLGEYFDKSIKTNGGKMNIKEVIMGFTIDVIASTSFATETNANGDRSKTNAFVEYGQKLFDFSFWRIFSVILLPKKFNVWIGNSVGLNDESFNFFVNLSREILRQRKLQKGGGGGGQKRQDLVQLMMDAFVYEDDLKKATYDNLTATAEDDSHETEKSEEQNSSSTSTKKALTENEIIAQCILFFAAGFETTATTISNALYNLAINPETQERLNEELSNVLDGVPYNSEQYYEIVMYKSPYLDAVIKETLRMSPPVTRLQRRVGVDNYKLGGISLTKDLEVDIAAYSVHYSPEYYPEPEKFNPDRFMPENKHLLTPYTYLPFGAGPRNCIGMRFAYQEMRLCLAKIIHKYQFYPTPETKIPLDYVKVGILGTKNIPLRVEKR